MMPWRQEHCVASKVASSLESWCTKSLISKAPAQVVQHNEKFHLQNVSTWSVRQPDWQKQDGYDVTNAQQAKAAARKDYSDWDPRLLDLVLRADDKVVPRDLHMLPVGHKWEHKQGVTLIGDAAHVMVDAMKLAELIITAASTSENSSNQKGTLDKNVKTFEQDMFKRATETQQLTVEKYIVRAVSGELGTLVSNIILAPIVYTWFFFFKLIY
ncbi:hypothetical protein AC579_6573 [Pseudocercospora musae]|uniref:FAD-binding domain-containing protein n=1 Tax=Pseudocercospora musae TaxID=113226 RepID=A0A139IAB4_9PEZI|nr:hypothetical protein AC579_6573 [Pseudocercospora musae]